MRSLLLIVAVFAAQLALFRSGLGCLLFGLHIVAVFIANLGVDLAVATWNVRQWIRGSESTLNRNHLFDTRYSRYFEFAHVLFVFSFLLTAVWYGIVDGVAQHRFETRLQQELGFTYRTELHDLPPAKGRLAQYAIITSVASGGVFDRAGFQTDDIILHERPALLFQMLAGRRGETVELTVLRPTASQLLLENCPQLILPLEVPP